MLTAKGTTYATLLAISTTYKRITLELKSDLGIDSNIIPDMIPIISARIISEVKPAGTLIKHLERIEHHKEQLLDAYTELFACYERMTTPATRTSPADKARSDLFSAMPDMKVLRLMCAVYIGEDAANSFVLPDDKTIMIAATVKVMRRKEETAVNTEDNSTKERSQKAIVAALHT